MFHALLDGPWIVFGHALSVQHWSPCFRASKGVIERATVWVRFPGIPVDRYHPEILYGLGDMVGQTVRADEHTLKMERGQFAKMAIVVDLTKPLPCTIRVDDEELKVVYERIPQICFQCGKTDHSQEVCPDRGEANGPAATVPQGEQNRDTLAGVPLFPLQHSSIG
ncbi:hypothetical protein Tsubulata_035915 [Turnera subulata]|uniref:CCHC-type domain-containing protein n=1 Tax=Turnera subulata TaxID=218843 RepID=A0A9Q0G0R8_9ROSI|nr:hypothetical protein Tsubulata_035915 [Turnera subulata]